MVGSNAPLPIPVIKRSWVVSGRWPTDTSTRPAPLVGNAPDANAPTCTVHEDMPNVLVHATSFDSKVILAAGRIDQGRPDRYNADAEDRLRA